uniref:Uncharacterized protein n=1 Tax=Glossina palpalis gambiensis TaxID=67801 RepID=A0A1B0B6H4_9MUSC
MDSTKPLTMKAFLVELNLKTFIDMMTSQLVWLAGWLVGWLVDMCVCDYNLYTFDVNLIFIYNNNNTNSNNNLTALGALANS